MNMRHRFPLEIEHDGPAACNPQDDCLFLLAPSGERVAVMNHHELYDAQELAQEITKRVNLHDQLVAALNASHERYGRLHDVLSEAIEGGTIESTRPELHSTLADLLVDCLHADVLTKAVLDELADKPAIPAAPQCLVDAAALLKSFGLDSMVASSAAELGVPLAAVYEARWGAGFHGCTDESPVVEQLPIAFFGLENGYGKVETDGISALKVGETWQSDFPTHTVKRIK